MTKEERIQEEWANCSLPKDLNELTGCFWFKTIINRVEHLRDEFDFIFWNTTECSIRPKSLQGIEDNNGWIKIEDKPITKFNDSFDIVFTNKGNIYTYTTYCNFSSIYELEKITHFQQITKPEPPIY